MKSSLLNISLVLFFSIHLIACGDSGQTESRCEPECQSNGCLECREGECVSYCESGEECDGEGNCFTSCEPACSGDDCEHCVEGACVSYCESSEECDGEGNCFTSCEPACSGDDCEHCVEGACVSYCESGEECDGEGTCSSVGKLPGLYVEGRHLYDYYSNRVPLIGVNAMTKYNDHGGVVQIPEIAKTGARVVRFHWDTNEEIEWHGKEEVLDRLDMTITRTIEHGMIPMVGIWDATGDWSKLQACVDWWVDPDVVAIIKKHEKDFLLNIANEAGNNSVTTQQFEDGYKSAITDLRDAGYQMPLVIDGAHYGRDENYLLDTAAALLAHDPLSNLIFSWHPWDGGSHAARYEAAIDAANALNICFIIGEFAHVSASQFNPVNDWKHLIEYSNSNDVGWMPWVWKIGTSEHNMTTDYIYGNWTSFGAEVVPYIEAASAP